MRFLNFYIVAAMSLFGLSARAQEFFSTEAAPSLFDIGVRLGVNSSVRTASGDVFDRWNTDSWGTGLEAGAVADLNLRDFLTIQPGVFFQCRSGNYSYAQGYYPYFPEADKDFTQMGHYRNYNLTVPVLASIRFNLAPRVRWAVEAGPYAQLNIKSSDKDKIRYMGPDSMKTAKVRRYDAGVKIGSGISWTRFSFNVHYMLGMRRVWTDEALGGRNKAWTFTLGYRL